MDFSFKLCGISDKEVIMRVFAVLGNMALNFHIRPQIGFMGGMKLISGELFLENSTEQSTIKKA